MLTYLSLRLFPWTFIFSSRYRTEFWDLRVEIWLRAFFHLNEQEHDQPSLRFFHFYPSSSNPFADLRTADSTSRRYFYAVGSWYLHQVKYTWIWDELSYHFCSILCSSRSPGNKGIGHWTCPCSIHSFSGRTCNIFDHKLIHHLFIIVLTLFAIIEVWITTHLSTIHVTNSRCPRLLIYDSFLIVLLMIWWT